jgi:branched-chain amino acid transport system permease protein
MSFVLIYKASQVVNFAQGEFLLVGAWVCWWLLTDWQLPFWLGFLFTLGLHDRRSAWCCRWWCCGR